MTSAGGAVALRTAESALRVAETALRIAELALAAEPVVRASAPAGAVGETPWRHAVPCARAAVAPRHATLHGRRRFLGWAVLLHELRRVRAAQRAAGVLAPSTSAPLPLSAARPQVAASPAGTPGPTHLRCVDPAWLSAALLPTTTRPGSAPLPGVR